MIYRYKNAEGRERVLWASMKSPPPHHIRFESDADDSDWSDAGDETPVSEQVFERVYGMPQVIVKGGGAVAHRRQRLPVSLSLPRTSEDGKVVNRYGTTVKQLECGAYATLDGRRIVGSAEDGRRHAADAGCVRVDD